MVDQVVLAALERKVYVVAAAVVVVAVGDAAAAAAAVVVAAADVAASSRAGTDSGNPRAHSPEKEIAETIEAHTDFVAAVAQGSAQD